MSRFSDSYITTIFGMRGCGKSTLTQALSNDEKFKRKIVFDKLEEWTGTHIVRSYDEFAGIWRDCFRLPQYTIVVRFSFGLDDDTVIETQNKICKLIFLTGRESELETCIIFEEAQSYFPNHGIHPSNRDLLTMGRHAFINIIANTQRPASISKLLISQSRFIYIGQLYEENDIKYLSGCVGSLAEHAKELEPRQFIFYPIGLPSDIKIIEL